MREPVKGSAMAEPHQGEGPRRQVQRVRKKDSTLQPMDTRTGRNEGDEQSLTDRQASACRGHHGLFDKNETDMSAPPVPLQDGHEMLDRCESTPTAPLANPDDSSSTDDKKATGPEVVSAQTIERGPAVTMEEIPDKEDNTAYQQWLAGQKAEQKEWAIQSDDDWVPTRPDMSAPPHSLAWYKPFTIDWTL